MKYLKKFNEAELFDDNKYGEFNKSALYYKLNGLGEFIHMDERKGGLGLKWVINRILDPYKTKINISDIDQNAIDLLIEGGIPEKVVKTKLENGLKGGTLFNKDGKWSFVNKLNTNYSAISMLLTDAIENGLAYNKEAIYPIYVEIMKDPKEGLMKIKKYIEPLIRRYIFEQEPDGSKIDDPDLKKVVQSSGDVVKDLEKYTEKIKKFSDEGEEAEDIVEDFLRGKRFQILYRGGNGDFIDMIFGADIITSYKGNIYFVQVKKTINQEEDLSKLIKRYKYIHLFIDGDNNVYKNKDRIKKLYE